MGLVLDGNFWIVRLDVRGWLGWLYRVFLKMDLVVFCRVGSDCGYVVVGLFLSVCIFRFLEIFFLMVIFFNFVRGVFYFWKFVVVEKFVYYCSVSRCVVNLRGWF